MPPIQCRHRLWIRCGGETSTEKPVALWGMDTNSRTTPPLSLVLSRILQSGNKLPPPLNLQTPGRDDRQTRTGCLWFPAGGNVVRRQRQVAGLLIVDAHHRRPPGLGTKT
ncbi:hypothetical protein CSHISOI_01484, partial [Colletotrichum shisoi]